MVLFFFYFPIKVAGATLLVAGENPRPPALNDNPEGPYSFELLKFHDFFHHLFTFSMTLCFAVTFKNVQNIPCFRVFFALNSSTDTNSGVHQNVCLSRCLITPLYLTLTLLCHLQ